MKPNELRSLRELTTKELEEKLAAVKEELFNLRFQLVTGHLEDHATVSKLRRRIAQLYTILAERRLAG
ncbi:MAG: 50S ribosomal protein L29 [Candidatus Eremiobacteraeota bacterium]|nr:50S ribosomal protein L29 [Candidatus Eremiobacteraeota bacterium]